MPAGGGSDRQGNPLADSTTSEPGQGLGSALPLLHSLNCAAVLVDDRAVVLAMNASMRNLLGPDLGVRQNRIEASDRTSNGLLRELISAAASGGALSHQMLPPVILRRSSQRPLVVQALPLGFATHRIVAMLIMNDLEYAPHLPEGRLALIFGLTKAEAKLAARLAMGESLEEAAVALGISIGTARNQVKSIFAKTDTSRQTQLVALLWRVARMAGNYGESWFDQLSQNALLSDLVSGIDELGREGPLAGCDEASIGGLNPSPCGPKTVS